MRLVIDIPDEVRDIALRQQLQIGRLPQWFVDLQAGTYRGHVPGELTAPERERIEKIGGPYRPLFVEAKRCPTTASGATVHLYRLGQPRCDCGASSAPAYSTGRNGNSVTPIV